MIQISGVTEDAVTALPMLEDFKNNFFRAVKFLRHPMVIGVNIKNFKYFNKIYGFDNGDAVLERMARFFAYYNPDCQLATRTHGDQFLILLEAHTMDESVVEEELGYLCRDFVREVHRDFPMARIHINCGVYFVKKTDKNFDEIRDRVRYVCKEMGDDYRSSVKFYDDELEHKILDEARIIPLFEEALEEKRILLYLQPKFSIDEQKLTGAEALARIRDKNGDILSPSSFVPILERSGLIIYLDRYIIKLLVDTMKSWKEQGIELFIVSVNLSRLDFMEEGFIEEIVDYVKWAGIPPRYIEFELTETVFCEDLDTIIKQIQHLREMGFRISMDDFGSGYNSLDVLGVVPADVIKFDRSFVLHSLKTEMGQEVMKHLMSMFQKINFEVLCEGVETKDEEQLVYACGCNQIQGYLHDRPLDVHTFEGKYIKEQ